MAQYPDCIAQWTLDVTVWHCPQFQHKLRAMVLGRQGDWVMVGEWPWRGLGFPAELIPDVTARITAVIEEHLITRYGLQGALPIRWAGEPSDS